MHDALVYAMIAAAPLAVIAAATARGARMAGCRRRHPSARPVAL